MRGDRWKEKVKENNKERKISMQRMRRRKEKGEREEKRGRRGRVRKGQRWTYKKDIERRKETMKKKRKTERDKKECHSQYHLLLAVWVFGFDLQLLYILVSDLWSFSGAPALVGC